MVDAIDELLGPRELPIEDGTICSILRNLNGWYGPVEIKPGTTGANGETGGDVYINGQLWWDCAGYEPGYDGPHRIT